MNNNNININNKNNNNNNNNDDNNNIININNINKNSIRILSLLSTVHAEKNMVPIYVVEVTFEFTHSLVCCILLNEATGLV